MEINLKNLGNLAAQSQQLAQLPAKLTPAVLADLMQTGAQLAATVVQDRGNNQYLLEVYHPASQTRVSLNAQSTTPLEPGRQIQLEVVEGGPLPQVRIVQQQPTTQETQVENALRQFLPKQQELSSLVDQLANFAKSGGQNALPPDIQQMARSLLLSLPDKNALTSADGLKQAVRDSGLFLESKLAQLAQADPQAGAKAVEPSLANDLKAKLLVLADALAGRAQTPSPAGTTDAAAKTPTPSGGASPTPATKPDAANPPATAGARAAPQPQTGPAATAEPTKPAAPNPATPAAAPNVRDAAPAQPGQAAAAEPAKPAAPGPATPAAVPSRPPVAQPAQGGVAASKAGPGLPGESLPSSTPPGQPGQTATAAASAPRTAPTQPNAQAQPAAPGGQTAGADRTQPPAAGTLTPQPAQPEQASRPVQSGQPTPYAPAARNVPDSQAGAAALAGKALHNETYPQTATYTRGTPTTTQASPPPAATAEPPTPGTPPQATAQSPQSPASQAALAAAGEPSAHDAVAPQTAQPNQAARPPGAPPNAASPPASQSTRGPAAGPQAPQNAATPAPQSAPAATLNPQAGPDSARSPIAGSWPRPAIAAYAAAAALAAQAGPATANVPNAQPTPTGQVPAAGNAPAAPPSQAGPAAANLASAQAAPTDQTTAVTTPAASAGPAGSAATNLASTQPGPTGQTPAASASQTGASLASAQPTPTSQTPVQDASQPASNAPPQPAASQAPGEPANAGVASARNAAQEAIAPLSQALQPPSPSAEQPATVPAAPTGTPSAASQDTPVQAGVGTTPESRPEAAMDKHAPHAVQHAAGNSSAAAPAAETVLKDLASQAEGALAKLVLNQLASLPQPDANQQVWRLEIPFTLAGQPESAKLDIEREAGEGGQGKSAAEHAPWSVTVQLSPPGLGNMGGKLTLHDGTVDAFFWSENPATAALVHDNLPLLQARLEAVGIKTGRLHAATGVSPPASAQEAQPRTRLLDLRA